MLLGFKRRFEAAILAKTKRHTIRGKRKVAPRVGETCHCYVNPRQKTMRLLGRWPCVRVQTVRIERLKSIDAGYLVGVWVDGWRLKGDELELLARSDGFVSFAEMMEFWKGRLPFHGDIIHWDPDAAQPAALPKAPDGGGRSGPQTEESS